MRSLENSASSASQYIHFWEELRKRTFPHLLNLTTQGLRSFHWILLQYMKVKSESEVAQSCPTLLDPMDCSLPGSSIHGIFQARVLEQGAIAFSDIFPQLRAYPQTWNSASALEAVTISICLLAMAYRSAQSLNQYTNHGGGGGGGANDAFY